jgi:hypothetical protein
VKSDDESNSEECGSSDVSNNVDYGRSDEVALNDEHKWEYCIDCDRFVKPRYYMHEEQMCQYCHEISLGKDEQCDSCGEVKHITLFRKPKLLYYEQCDSNPEGLNQYCVSCKCVYNGVIGISTFKLRNTD